MVTRLNQCFAVLTVLAGSVGLADRGLADRGLAAGLSADELLVKIKSDDANVRSAAWPQAGPAGAEAVAPLGELMAGDDKGVARAATEALRTITHYAGRPDRPAERKAVEAALVKLLDASRPTAVRAEAADLLSFVGGDAAVDALSPLLGDKAVREQARRAIERIPGDSATMTLISALAKADDSFKIGLINALGQRRAVGAVDALLNEIESNQRAVALAAGEALSRIGETPTREFHAPILDMENLTDAERQQVGRMFLRYAGRRADKNDADGAAEIYERMLENAQSDHLMCAAVVGLGKLGTRSLSLLLPHLAHHASSVRAVVRQSLIEMPGDDADARLESEAATADPALRASLLRVVAARKTPNAGTLLKKATEDENAEVKVTAFDLLGGLNDASLEHTVLEAAEWGSPAVREVALGSYLRMAASKLGDNDEAGALEMYHRSLKLAINDATKNQALSGMAAIADTDSLPLVEQAMAEPATAEAGALAYVAIAAKIGMNGDKKLAVAMISDAVKKSGASPVLDVASARLRSLGADVAELTRQIGFVTDWYLIGTFPNPNKLGFSREYFPEKNIDLEAGGKFGQVELAWKKIVVDSIPAKIDLTKHFTNHDDVAIYGYAEIDSPTAREINLRVGSDDGCKVWLNGEQVHATNASRGFSLDSDTIATQLVEGKNTLLIKVLQGGGDWAMCARIADRENRPIDLRKR